MNQNSCYENYPLRFVIGSNTLQIAIYIIGVYLVYKLGPFWIIPYLIYIAILEIRLLKTRCVNCYYYNKRCTFGKGKLCALFFKKGSPKIFLDKQFRRIDLIPDFLVSIVPLVIGVVLLIVKFDLMILIFIILLILLAFPVSGYLRGSLACRHCKQRELGCPAEQLFKKNS